MPRARAAAALSPARPTARPTDRARASGRRTVAAHRRRAGLGAAGIAPGVHAHRDRGGDRVPRPTRRRRPRHHVVPAPPRPAPSDPARRRGPVPPSGGPAAETRQPLSPAAPRPAPFEPAAAGPSPTPGRGGRPPPASATTWSSRRRPRTPPDVPPRARQPAGRSRARPGRGRRPATVRPPAGPAPTQGLRPARLAPAPTPTVPPRHRPDGRAVPVPTRRPVRPPAAYPAAPPPGGGSVPPFRHRGRRRPHAHAGAAPPSRTTRRSRPRGRTFLPGQRGRGEPARRRRHRQHRRASSPPCCWPGCCCPVGADSRAGQPARRRRLRVAYGATRRRDVRGGLHLAGAAGRAPDGRRSRRSRVKFVQLIRRWPDESWSFAVNPGTPVGAKLPGEQIVALASWAAEVGLGDDAGAGAGGPPPSAEPAGRARYAPAGRDPTRPTVMQKAIAAEPARLLPGTRLRPGLRLRAPGRRGRPPAHARPSCTTRSGWATPARRSRRTPTRSTCCAGRRTGRASTGSRTAGSTRRRCGRWRAGSSSAPPFRGNGFAPGESSDVIAEFKVDSVRLPHGAQLWRMDADGTERRDRRPRHATRWSGDGSGES